MSDGLYNAKGIWKFRYPDPLNPKKWKQHSTGVRVVQPRKGEPRPNHDALRVKMLFMEQLKSGQLPTEMKDWKMSQAEKWWLDEFRRPRIAKSTYNVEKYILKHFREYMGDCRLGEIQIRHLHTYQSKRLEQGIGAAAINKELIKWTLILQEARLWNRMKDEYRPLKVQASDVGRALTRPQLQRLVEIAQGHDAWKVALYGSILAANTGLRGGEVKKLRIQIIDLENRELKILRRDAKTDGSARFIPLNLDAVAAVEVLLTRYRNLLYSGKVVGKKVIAEDPDHFLLPKNLNKIAHGSEKGRRGYSFYEHQLDWDTAWGKLTSAIQCPNCGTLQQPGNHCTKDSCKADIAKIRSSTEGIRFHDLRHTFITHMVEKGVPIERIMTIVGHLSARMVRHYAHVASDLIHEDVRILDSEPLLSHFTSSGSLHPASIQ